MELRHVGDKTILVEDDQPVMVRLYARPSTQSPSRIKAVLGFRASGALVPCPVSGAHYGDAKALALEFRLEQN